MKYRIELGRHGKDTRVYEHVDETIRITENVEQAVAKVEITTKIDLIELRVPCNDRPTLTLRSPFDDFDDRVLEVELGTLEIMSHEPGEV